MSPDDGFGERFLADGGANGVQDGCGLWDGGKESGRSGVDGVDDREIGIV